MAPRAEPQRGISRLQALIAVCVGANLIEGAVALGYRVPGGVALAPQAAAPAPIGLFADMRWLLVYEHSWWTFFLLALGIFVTRTVLTAIQVVLAWPGAAPPLPRVLARAACFDLAASALLAPFALLLFGFAAFPVSWLYLAAVPAAVVISWCVHEGAIRRWWHHGPGLRSTAWLLGSFLALTGAAGLARGSVPVALVVVGAAGVFDAYAWRGIVGTLGRERDKRLLPLAPILLVGFLAGAIVAAESGFANATTEKPSGADKETATLSPSLLSDKRAVLFVSGFSSHLDQSSSLPAVPAGDVAVRFSYAGSTASGLPLNYAAPATHASVDHLVGVLARQVARLARTTRRSVDIVADSEGAVVTEAYLAESPRPPLESVVLVSPLLYAGAVSYPAAHTAGWGVAAGSGLQLLSSLLAPISTGVDLSPSQPFLRSLVSRKIATELAMGCRACAHHLRELVIVPLADSLAGLPASSSLGQTIVVAAFHGADLSEPAVNAAVWATLEGKPVRGDRTDSVLATVIGDCASAWRVPGLRADLR